MTACGRKCGVACSFAENYVTDWHKYFNNLLYNIISSTQPYKNFSTNNTLNFNCFFQQNGQTPLIIAAEMGNVEIVHELIKRNAQVNAQDHVCFVLLLFVICCTYNLPTVSYMYWGLTKPHNLNFVFEKTW